MKIKQKQKDAKDFLQQADEARFNVTRDILKGIEAAEIASGTYVEAQAADSATQARIAELKNDGFDRDTAVILAVQEKVGEDQFYAHLAQTPERKALEALKPY
jgi:hypothetical protein